MPSHKLRLQALEIGQTKVIITAKCEGKKQNSVTLNINVTESTQSNVGALSPNESKESVNIKPSNYTKNITDLDLLIKFYSLDYDMFYQTDKLNGGNNSEGDYDWCYQENTNKIKLAEDGILKSAEAMAQIPNETRTAEEIAAPLIAQMKQQYIDTYQNYVYSPNIQILYLSYTNKRDEYLDPINPPDANGYNYKVKDSILAKNPDEMLTFCKELKELIIANYDVIKKAMGGA